MSTSSSQRPYGGGGPSYAGSPTTASSLGYSQYGSSSFSGNAAPPPGPIRQQSASASLGYRGGPPPMLNTRSASSNSNPGGGLRPPLQSQGSAGRSDSRDVARVHWRALKEFLASWLEKESPSARASAREKLTRLTKLQFQELSTDVYDELMRRTAVDNGAENGNVPFLPVRDDFHPKRNQARQKLATLPKNRFKDLASDVYYELRRRYPEFEEEQARSYDQPPPAPGPVPIRPTYSQTQSQQSLRDRPRDSPTPPPAAMNRLISSQSTHSRQGSRGMSQSSHRSRPSRDRDEEVLDDLNSSSPRQQRQMNPLAATNEVVVPNKSRMREEDIEVPYARDSQMMDVRRSRTSSRPESRSSAGRESRTSRASLGPSASIDGDRDRDRDRARERSTTPQPSQMEVASPAPTDDRVYYDRMSFSSNVTNKSKQAAGQNTGWDEEREKKIRAEYEFKIAGLERRALIAENEREEARRSQMVEKERRQEWEDEVRGLKERAATHASALRSIQHELDLAKDAVEASKLRADQATRSAEDEIAQWRDRYEGLEDEYRRLEDEKAGLESMAGNNGDSEQAVAELKSELHSLVDELNALSMRNEELEGEREQDAMGMNEMEAKVEEYKRKYDAVRIELRNLKATSVMFVSKPVTDDHLPASADGNITDINVSAFQSAIDGLLAAARSSAPSGVLPAMKAIVESITEIGEDVKAFEQKPNLSVDVSRLESLKHESTTRLNNLMQAARNHAMASGLSPVSLLDAAAGHLSANVVEIIKLLKIRRGGQKAPGRQGLGQELGSRRSSLSIKDMVNRGEREKEVKAANGNWDRQYGSQEKLNDNPPPPVRVRSPSDDRMEDNNFKLNVNGGRGQERPALRINSFQSTSSIARSDSFDYDLERKSSMIDRDRSPAPAASAAPLSLSRGPLSTEPPLRSPDSVSGGIGRAFASAFGFGNTNTNNNSNSTSTTPAIERQSLGMSMSSQTSASAPMSGQYASGNGNGKGGEELQVEAEFDDDDDDDEFENRQVEENDGSEWDDLRPYLNAQSSALVNSIQNLLAAIRTNSSPSTLNEHLSEVIAIASSIVAVSTNSLPSSLRKEGNDLLKELVGNTNKLSEAQQDGAKGGFEKTTRQQIASASFGVAKALKALMKLGE